jgi:hypothetical protein
VALDRGTAVILSASATDLEKMILLVKIKKASKLNNIISLVSSSFIDELMEMLWCVLSIKKNTVIITLNSEN